MSIATQHDWNRMPTDTELRRVRDLMYSALRARGIPHQDADDAVQDALEKILRQPELLSQRVVNLPENSAYFARMALNSLRMKLRSERRRRRREQVANDQIMPTVRPGTRRRVAGEFDDESENSLSGASDLVPRLTDRQREYLDLVMTFQLSVKEIAELKGVSPRSVRAVLQRARDILRDARS